jgi:hypothetical protein
MNKIVLCLDIDDCIVPASSTYFGNFDDSLEIMALNMKRIKAMIEMFDMGVFITSSWYTSLTITDDKLLRYNREHLVNEETGYLTYIYDAFKILKNGIGNRAIGLSCGDRRRDIATLLNDGYKVIAMDDMCLHSSTILKNCEDVDLNALGNKYLFLQVRGFITNEHTFIARSFLDKE